LSIQTWGHVLILKPHFCVELVSLRVIVNATCEVFVKDFRLIFLLLKTDLIWVQTLTPRFLEIFFHLSHFWSWRPIFIDDFFKAGNKCKQKS
jgi:hypothetical protein